MVYKGGFALVQYMVGRITKCVSLETREQRKNILRKIEWLEILTIQQTVSLSGCCILEYSWAQASLHKINSNSGPCFPDSAPASYHVPLLWVCGYSFCDMVLILRKYLFLAFSPLFIYLRQDLQCSSAKRASSSRFSFLVLLSVELEAFPTIPGCLLILSYVPLLPQRCSHVSVDMSFLL